ncbi:MAG: ABC transporter ATP-binding protein [Halothiobacillaceae bacterium]
MSSTAPMYRLEGVSRRRAQGGSAFELIIPALEIHAGELVAIVGESGCGKSTLLDLLALVLRPSRAEIFGFHAPGHQEPTDVGALWLADREDRLAAMRREYMGYVLQTGGLLPFLSVRGNIELPARVAGRPARSLARLAADLGISGLLDRMPHALSVGQRQRVAIARAVAHGPALVLADEPTAAVDQGRARKIMEELATLARAHGTAVVVVTHDRRLVEPLMDRGYGFEVASESDDLTVSVCSPLVCQSVTA